MEHSRRSQRGQTALEYVMIIGGAILFVVLVVIILRSGILGGGVKDVENKANEFEGTYLQNYLVFENFNSGTAKKWTEAGCTGWTVADGKYKSPLVAGDCFSFVSGIYDNFTLEFKVRRTGGAGVAGAIFRSDGTRANSYAVILGTSTISLNHNGADLWSYGIFPLDISTSEVSVKVKVYSNNFGIYVNDNKIGDMAGGGAPFSGKAGLMVSGMAPTSSEFDYFRISR